ncbi:hypothetical protein CLV86_2624 [Lacinutrix venerupis]|uniref:hypothetical protein n=1 Tax=Lacinutrix venerupis TaxID=1486034 RepID=UPI000EB3FD6F|nr:hypothetical protein [Lacinutrix venerupis]RLJ61601.1 hypothetical protein CLV86_2624 [Lacinutrix venerupis]
MRKTKNCKHCDFQFEARRSNHVYCTNSCKTKASYKRNNYKYVSGHYQKDKVALNKPAKTSTNSISLIEEKLNSLEKKMSGLNLDSVQNVMLGSVAADGISYGLKKVFASNTLPATKKDIIDLKNELDEIKLLLHQNKPFGF